jgi:predicted permease
VLVCGGLFVQSLRQMTTINLGFRSENLVMASLDLGLQGYQDKRGLQFHQQLTETVRALPGVKEVSMAGAVPFDNAFQFRDVSAEGQIASSGQADKEDYIQAGLNRVDTHYLRTMGIMLLRGRDFTEQDGESAPKVAIINQTMAQRLWPQQDALGKRFRLGRDGDYVQVVGMVSTGKYVMLGEGPRPYLYVPLAQDYSSPATLHVRTAGDPLVFVPTVRRVLQTLDPDLPIYNVRTMQEHLRQSAFALMPLRMGAVLAGSQGLLGLLLAVMGIYGVVAYVVSQRSREIGIRMALGAQRLDVLKLVVRGGLKLTVIGMGIGLLVALAVVRLLSGLLYGLNPMSLTVFIAAMALLTGVAMFACYMPARHATKINPVDALRQE